MSQHSTYTSRRRRQCNLSFQMGVMMTLCLVMPTSWSFAPQPLIGRFLESASTKSSSASSTTTVTTPWQSSSTSSSSPKSLSSFSYRNFDNSLRMAVGKSGGKTILTTEEYNDMVLSKEAPRPVLVFFTAPWCGPCRLSIPVVKDAVKKFSGKIDVVEVCTDDLAEVASDSGVVSIPTIQFYYNGENLDTIVGCVAQSVLSSACEKVLDDLSL